MSQGRGRDCSGDEAVAEGTERGTQLLSAGHVSAAAPEIHCLGEVHHESGKHKSQGLNILLCIYNIFLQFIYLYACLCLQYCQMCRKGDNEDLLLLCDGCDKGCHTYCHKPKITNIPEGDWYCPACISKVTASSSIITSTSTHLLRGMFSELCL